MSALRSRQQTPVQNQAPLIMKIILKTCRMFQHEKSMHIVESDLYCSVKTDYFKSFSIRKIQNPNVIKKTSLLLILIKQQHLSILDLQSQQFVRVFMKAIYIINHCIFYQIFYMQCVQMVNHYLTWVIFSILLELKVLAMIKCVWMVYSLLYQTHHTTEVFCFNLYKYYLCFNEHS